MLGLVVSTTLTPHLRAFSRPARAACSRKEAGGGTGGRMWLRVAASPAIPDSATTPPCLHISCLYTSTPTSTSPPPHVSPLWDPFPHALVVSRPEHKPAPQPDVGPLSGTAKELSACASSDALKHSWRPRYSCRYQNCIHAVVRRLSCFESQQRAERMAVAAQTQVRNVVEGVRAGNVARILRSPGSVARDVLEDLGMMVGPRLGVM